MTNKLISTVSLSALALSFAAGCATDMDDPSSSDDPSADPATDPSPGVDGIQPDVLSRNIHDAFVYFVRKGLTKRQSAGIVGNLMQESQVNPRAVQQGGPGRGIAQWSAGGRWDTSAGDNVTAYANNHGESRWALDTQLDFTWHELTAFPTYGLHDLRGRTTIAGATIAFMTDFERCGECLSSQRIEYAHEVFNAYAKLFAVDPADDTEQGDTSTDADAAAPAEAVDAAP